jgi:hypothetical protein
VASPSSHLGDTLASQSGNYPSHRESYTGAVLKHLLTVTLAAVIIGLLVAIVVLLLTGEEAAAPGPPNGFLATARLYVLS